MSGETNANASPKSTQNYNNDNTNSRAERPYRADEYLLDPLRRSIRDNVGDQIDPNLIIVLCVAVGMYFAMKPKDERQSSFR